MMRLKMSSLNNLVVICLMAQSYNVIFWKFYKLGGMLIISSGLIQWGFDFNFNSSTFLIFCTVIGLMVVIYSGYYMVASEVGLFTTLVTLFIMSMLLLTSSSNMLTMFVGWESVGVLSFILIGWFMSRSKAISASFSAFIFNRFADFFFIVLIVLEFFFPPSLFLPNVSYFLQSVSLSDKLFIIVMSFSFWMASAGKSAQFNFHPWLTLAMEGPTPVSGLLHSSTMVVAGVYLLLKLHPYVMALGCQNLNMVLIFSSVLTLILTSLWALAQMDIKKIIALSTTSQLSLMMVLVCIGGYDMAFLHMILHGFFKALLFLGSGVNIHSAEKQDQSIVKLSLQSTVNSPFLYMVFIVGVLGLMGAPFLGSFCSKHLIFSYIPEMFPLPLFSSPESGVKVSSLAMMGLSAAPLMTMAYSFKLLSFITQSHFKAITMDNVFNNVSMSTMLSVTVPLTVLMLGVVYSGLLSGDLFSSGVKAIYSSEDPLFSTFVFFLIMSSLLYILFGQSTSFFMYNYSGLLINKMFSLAHLLMSKTFYSLIEYLLLKAGLKKCLPIKGINQSMGPLLFDKGNMMTITQVYLISVLSGTFFTKMSFLFLLNL